MNRLRGWWRIAVGVAALVAIPVLVEAHTLTGAGGWWDELVCLVPALVMVVVVLVVGRDPSTRQKNGKSGNANPSSSGKTGDSP